jgi:hypothetical protein
MTGRRGSRKRSGEPRLPDPRSGNLPGMSTTTYWGLREIADYLGVKYSSARTYHGRAEINRRKGTSRPGDMPAPDHRFGNSPVWDAEKIIVWKHTARPGKGAFGGRPKGPSRKIKPDDGPDAGAVE